MKKFYSLSIFLALFFSVLIVGNLEAATYYIDGSSGKDNNPGTIELPWKTIGKANSTLKAGDTAKIKGGEYHETIRPNNSGTSINYITYAKYGEESVTITEASVGADLSNKSYIKIDRIKFKDTKAYWINLDRATYCIIQNCYMENARAWSGINMRNGANYNRILNNTLVGGAILDNGVDYSNGLPNDLLYCTYSNYNLIQGNAFVGGTHNAVDIQNSTHCVFRNNTVSNRWHTGIEVTEGTIGQNLIENNIITDCGEDHDINPVSEVTQNKPRDTHPGLKIGSPQNIVRHNVLVNNGCLSLNSYENANYHGNDNRIYHNTFYLNYRGIYTTSDTDVYNNRIKNNVFHQQRNYEIYFNTSRGSQNDNYYYFNNLSTAPIKYNSVNGSLSEVTSRYPSEWQNNMSVNPSFVAPGNNDFTLSSGSPMIDAADFLTTTKSSGSGKSIKVEDASYFCDGWGIINGDLIQLEGQSMKTRILNISYGSNTITVDKALSWNAGIGVSLPYTGSAPDIGAYKYEAPNTLDAPTRLRIK